MNIFQVSLSRLQTLYSFSRKISIIDSAKRASTQRTIELEKMLEKILLHDHSILVLLSVVPEQIQEFDVSLIASAARNIMESANIYFHISQRGIDTDTIKFRVETMALNEIYNEIDITKKLGFSQDCVPVRTVFPLNRCFETQAEFPSAPVSGVDGIPASNPPARRRTLRRCCL